MAPPGPSDAQPTQALVAVSALRWVIVGLAAAAAYTCWSLWPALVLAAWTATLLRPLLLRFARGLKGRRRAAAALSLLLFLLLLIPLALVVLGGILGAQELAQALSRTGSAKGALVAIAAGTDAAPSLQFPTSVREVMDLWQRYGAEGLSVVTGLAGAAAKGLVAIFIYFSGAFVFLLNGPEVWAWMKRHSPLAPHHLERLAAAFQETGRGLLVGVGLTSASQGLVATVAYVSLGIPRWWVLGPITGLASMIPLVGSALIWGPITAGLFLTNRPIKGAILAVIGVGVISLVDNLLRPIYARWGALKMPTFLLFTSIFGGMIAFGAWGVVLGPLVVRLLLEALALRHEAASETAVTGAEP